MAIGFGTTNGVGSTDIINTGLIGQATQRTYAFRCRYNSTGGAAFGRVISTDSLAEYIGHLSGLIGFSRQWSGVQYQWLIAGTGTAGTTYSIVVQYDSSSASNNAVAWLNGAAATITNPVARTGTPDTDANPYRIGNRGDLIRNFDGWISSVAIWNALIPANMAQLISGSFSPLIYLSNLIYYNPMIRNSVDIAGGRTQTATGTAVQPHQPILRELGGGFV